MTTPAAARLGRLLLALGIASAAYVLTYRPLNLRWGATSAELEQVLPGDDLVPSPDFLATRAITIDAPPEDVWPWLVQIGYTRAGWYGYDWVENVVDGRVVPSAERIIPELQQIAVGDTLPVSPIANMRLLAIDPGRSLLWIGFDERSTWAMVLVLLRPPLWVDGLGVAAVGVGLCWATAAPGRGCASRPALPPPEV